MYGFKISLNALSILCWCYGQDSNLRTPAGKDFPSGRSSQSVEILSPSPLTWLGYRSTRFRLQTFRFSFLLMICRG